MLICIITCLVFMLINSIRSKKETNNINSEKYQFIAVIAVIIGIWFGIFVLIKESVEFLNSMICYLAT